MAGLSHSLSHLLAVVRLIEAQQMGRIIILLIRRLPGSVQPIRCHVIANAPEHRDVLPICRARVVRGRVPVVDPANLSVILVEVGDEVGVVVRDASTTAWFCFHWWSDPLWVAGSERTGAGKQGETQSEEELEKLHGELEGVASGQALESKEWE